MLERRSCRAVRHVAGKENTFLASVYFAKTTTGIAFLDLSTGEFYVAEGEDAYIDKLISNLQPREIVFQRGMEERFNDTFGTKHYTYRLDEWVFSEAVNRDKLTKQLGVQSLKGFGIEGMSAGISAAGAILYYLEFTEQVKKQSNIGWILGMVFAFISPLIGALIGLIGSFKYKDEFNKKRATSAMLISSAMLVSQAVVFAYGFAIAMQMAKPLIDSAIASVA